MTPFAQLNYPWGFKKYTYINKTYGLASQWDGISLGWSAQMRRWKLVWESDAPASTFFLTHISHYGRSAKAFSELLAANKCYNTMVRCWPCIK